MCYRKDTDQSHTKTVSHMRAWQSKIFGNDSNKICNTCYHLVWNLLSSSLLSKNINIIFYKTMICIFCMGVTLCLML